MMKVLFWIWINILKKNNLNNSKILIRGAGELASAIGLTLHRVGFKVIMTDLPIPQAIRRSVCFSEAIFNNQSTVEEIMAEKSDANYFYDVLKKRNIPVLIDSVELLIIVKPDYYVDSRMLKKDIFDRRAESYLTIGLGPGFEVGKNCDVIIETVRGHNLGKVLWNGVAKPNTKVPGIVGGESAKRVIHAPKDGKLCWLVNFGDIVKENQVIGKIDDIDLKSQINGIVRGLISTEVKIRKRMKIADVDPRGKEVDFNTISDKARNIGRGVLEAILVDINKQNGI